MTGISSLARVPPLLSPRTASYVAALIREGDTFDYSKWLQEVRRKEREGKQVRAVHASDAPVCRELGYPSNKPERRDVWSTVGPMPITRSAAIPIAISRTRHGTQEETPEARLTHG